VHDWVSRRVQRARAPRAKDAVVSAFILLALSVSACASPRLRAVQDATFRPPGPSPSSLAPTTSLPTAKAVTATSAAPSVSATAPTTTAFPEPVRVSANGGNVFIRRGPHPAFNAIGILYDGQSVEAIGRDMLGHWLQISLVDSPGTPGWISVQTRFTSVSGATAGLAVMDLAEWPEAAYLRNCTLHLMLVEPEDITLLSALEFPQNEVRLFPGVYTVQDLEVEGQPEVLTFSVREGEQIDIREDGDGNRRKCH